MSDCDCWVEAGKCKCYTEEAVDIYREQTRDMQMFLIFTPEPDNQLKGLRNITNDFNVEEE